MEIIAKGVVSNAAIRIDIRVNPTFIHPPQFDLLFLIPTAPGAAVMLPFLHSEVFPFPEEASSLIIRDRSGVHSVAIEGGVQLMAAQGLDGKNRHFGTSRNSLEEAVDQAVGLAEAELLPEHPDQEHVFRIVESGKIKGGIAGRNLFFAIVEKDAGSSKAEPAIVLPNGQQMSSTMKGVPDFEIEPFVILDADQLENDAGTLDVIAKAKTLAGIEAVVSYNSAGTSESINASYYNITKKGGSRIIQKIGVGGSEPRTVFNCHIEAA